jgi:hypothetical protein
VSVALLLTFPSQLFNETLEENYADISEWWRRRLRAIRTFVARKPRPADDEPKKDSESVSRDRWRFVAVLGVGALINSLNDGHFGFTLGSLMTFFGVILALGCGVAIPATVATLYHAKRHGDAEKKLHAIPAGLAIAAVLLIFSRLIDFEPGYLYGVVYGVIFARKLEINERGHVAALTVLTTLAVSVGAWIAWVPVNAAAERPGAFLGTVLADDFLAALFVSGLVGSFFGMMPIKGLPGWTVKHWSGRAWAVAFTLAVFGLFQILLRPGVAGHGHRPLVASIALFVGFGAGSVIFHEHFESKSRRARGESVPSLHERIRSILLHAREQSSSPAE